MYVGNADGRQEHLLFLFRTSECLRGAPPTPESVASPYCRQDVKARWGVGVSAVSLGQAGLGKTVIFLPHPCHSIPPK